MVEQLLPYSTNIHIINNNSTYKPLLDYLHLIEGTVTIHWASKNFGHTAHELAFFQEFHKNGKYFLTDPDLTLNKKLPSNFLDIFDQLSEQYQAHKVGFALNITDPNVSDELTNVPNTSAKQWEAKYWVDRIENPMYELYWADIDTTFCLVNTNYKGKPKIRVAGDFTCIHRPWMQGWRDEFLPDELLAYKQENISSTWLRNHW